MLTIPTSLRVFAHRFATDMRKSFHGLVGIIESELGQQVESGHLFLFFNRRRDRVKILFFTGDGLMILYRLLERGTFETPRGWRDQSPKDTKSNSHGIELRMSDLALNEQVKALSFDERRVVHERQSRPLIERLFASWDEARPTLRPSTKLAEAIGYALNRRAELTRFLDDGRIALDTGHLERSLRPVAIGRKNYLFYGSLRGGQTAATLYSVVQSARLYHLDVTAYLTDVLRQFPAILPTDTAAIRSLLPDQWANAHPEQIHASRDEELRADNARRNKRRAKHRREIVQ